MRWTVFDITWRHGAEFVEKLIRKDYEYVLNECTSYTEGCVYVECITEHEIFHVSLMTWGCLSVSVEILPYCLPCNIKLPWDWMGQGWFSLS